MSARSQHPSGGSGTRSDYALLPSVDLKPALSRAVRHGVAVVPEAVPEIFLARMVREIRNAPLRPAPRTDGPVIQDAEMLTITEFGDYPALGALRSGFAARVREQGKGIRGLAGFDPNEAIVQRYRPGSEGISSHRDGKRYRRLVAVLTIRGRATIAVQTERNGEPVAAWDVQPGSLVLLRAPGLAGYRDGRLFHAISGPVRGARMSVGLRMNTSPD